MPVQPFQITRIACDCGALLRALAEPERTVSLRPGGLFLSGGSFVAWKECRHFVWVRADLGGEIKDPLLRPVGLTGVSLVWQLEPDLQVELKYPANWHPLPFAV